MPWPSWVQCSHLHAQGSRSTNDVNCGPEPCQSGPTLTFPVSCLCLLCRGLLSVPELSFRSRACAYPSMYVHDDHYLTHSLSPHLNDHPTNMYIYLHNIIKLLPIPRVFGAHSGSPRIKNLWTYYYCTCICISHSWSPSMKAVDFKGS